MTKQKRELQYKKIENYIIKNIENHVFVNNSKLPSENELCDMFNVSRMTVNKALTYLSNQGYIVRIPGKGSFVKSFRVDKLIPEMTSFSEELERAGIKSTSQLIRYSVISAGQEHDIAQKLNAADDELIHFFVRLRLGDDKPLAVSYNYLLVKHVPMLDINCLKSSLYKYLETDLNLEISHNDTVIQVVKPNDEVKELLKISDSSEVVKSAHISYLINNVPFEYTETFYISNQYSFHYRCYRDSQRTVK